MINPIWLHTFITLVETRHFTRAAERLFMTQPGVTQHIKKLEAKLNQALLIREGKGFELTDAGLALYHFALEREQKERDFVSGLQPDAPYTGELSLACSGALALYLYPKLLELQCQHPNLKVHLEAQPNHSIISKVRNKALSLGLISGAQAKDLENRPLGSNPLQLVLPAGAEVAEGQLAETLQTLGFINHPDGMHYLKQVINTSLPTLSLDTLVTRGSINQIGQILLPVAQGLGFSVLPKTAVDAFPQPERVQVIDLEIQESVFLIHRSAPLKLREQMLIDKLRAWLT